MKIQLHYITASVIEEDICTTTIRPFRGIAFRDPQTGTWCGLRSGCSIVYYLGDTLNIRHRRPVRETWQAGLLARLPSRVTLAQLPFIVESGTATLSEKGVNQLAQLATTTPSPRSKAAIESAQALTHKS